MGQRAHRLVVAPLLALAALSLAACGKRDSGPAPEPAPLARVNDRVLSEEDVLFEAQRRRQAGRAVGDAESILRDLIERETMLQAAAKSEAMNDPEVRRELENQQLARWIERTLQAEKDRAEVSDEALRKAYEEQIASFTRPALVRLAILYRKADPRDPTENRASLTAELEKAREAYLSDPLAARQGGRMQGFGAIAAEHSEDAVSRYRGGDLGWLDLSRTDHRVPAPVLEAGRALEIGEVSPVINTDHGLYVVMRTDWRDAQVAPFEEVAPTLRRKLIAEQQRRIEDTFKARLAEGQTVEINRERLARVELPAPPPAPERPSLRPASEFTPPVAGLPTSPTSTP